MESSAAASRRDGRRALMRKCCRCTKFGFGGALRRTWSTAAWSFRRYFPELKCAWPISPADVARHAKLIVTVTAAREPILSFEDVAPGTLISAVGSDSPGKQELHPQILTRASLLLVDSIGQCEKLGELQHAPSAHDRAMEIGKFCAFHPAVDASGVVVADFTGLGVEDLFIAEDCYRKLGG